MAVAEVYGYFKDHIYGAHCWCEECHGFVLYGYFRHEHKKFSFASFSPASTATYNEEHTQAVAEAPVAEAPVG